MTSNSRGCLVCGLPVEGTDYNWMINNSLWQQAGFDKGHAHLECLEARIGRRVGFDDFADYWDAPINTGHMRRLSSRPKAQVIRFQAFYRWIDLRLLNEMLHEVPPEDEALGARLAELIWDRFKSGAPFPKQEIVELAGKERWREMDDFHKENVFVYHLLGD